MKGNQGLEALAALCGSASQHQQAEQEAAAARARSSEGIVVGGTAASANHHGQQQQQQWAHQQFMAAKAGTPSSSSAQSAFQQQMAYNFQGQYQAFIQAHANQMAQQMAQQAHLQQQQQAQAQAQAHAAAAQEQAAMQSMPNFMDPATVAALAAQAFAQGPPPPAAHHYQTQANNVDAGVQAPSSSSGNGKSAIGAASGYQKYQQQMQSNKAEPQAPAVVVATTHKMKHENDSSFKPAQAHGAGSGSGLRLAEPSKTSSAALLTADGTRDANSSGAIPVDDYTGKDDNGHESMEKKEAKRAANRRSAQLSRKRKKHFIEELKEENEDLRRKEQILRSIPDLIVMFNSGGILRFVSHSVSTLLDFDPQDLEGTSFWHRLCEDSVRLLKAAFMDALAARTSGMDSVPLGDGLWKIRLKNRDGSQKLVTLNGVVHFANGSDPECVCSIRPKSSNGLEDHVSSLSSSSARSSPPSSSSSGGGREERSSSQELSSLTVSGSSQERQGHNPYHQQQHAISEDAAVSVGADAFIKPQQSVMSSLTPDSVTTTNKNKKDISAQKRGGQSASSSSSNRSAKGLKKRIAHAAGAEAAGAGHSDSRSSSKRSNNISDQESMSEGDGNYK